MGEQCESHDVDVEWVPVCGVCWRGVHLDDDDRWVHSEDAPGGGT